MPSAGLPDWIGIRDLNTLRSVSVVGNRQEPVWSFCHDTSIEENVSRKIYFVLLPNNTYCYPRCCQVKRPIAGVTSLKGEGQQRSASCEKTKASRSFSRCHFPSDFLTRVYWSFLDAVFLSVFCIYSCSLCI